MKLFTRLAVTLAATVMAGGILGASGASAAPAAGAQESPAIAASQDGRPRPDVSPKVACGYYSGTALTQRGHTGNRVREVQCLLIYWGYSVGPTGIDGDFGPATDAAVRLFQAETDDWCGPPGLVSDGKVGTKTWATLRAPNGCPPS